MQRNILTILISVFFGSLLLSVLAVALDPVINNDAIWYLSVADLFAQGEYLQAIRSDVYYEWPFYSFVIGVLSGITGLHVETSAHILNALFIAIAITTFVAIAYELSHKDYRIALIAAVVFLLLPTLNDYRAFIIRDFGYLACYGLGLYALTRYCSDPSYRFAFMWGIVMLLAVLFRSEGIIFLALAPVYLLLRTAPFSRSNWIQYARVNIVLWFVLLVAALVVGYLSLTNNNVHLSGLIVQHTDRALSVLTSANELLGHYAAILKRSFLNVHEGDILKIYVLIIIVSILAAEFVMSVTVPYSILWLIALRQRWFSRIPAGLGLWKTFIWLNIALLFVFVFSILFLVSRYTLAFLLTFMLCMPFLLMRFYSEVWRRKINMAGKAAVMFLCLLFVYNVLDSFVSTGASRDYQKQAGLWLKQTMQPGDELFSSVAIVAYYAGQINLSRYKNNPDEALNVLVDYNFSDVKKILSTSDAARFRYFAIRLRPRKNEIIADIEKSGKLELLKAFENSKGDQIVIYRSTS